MWIETPRCHVNFIHITIKISVKYTVSSMTSVSRIHGNDYYYEYGSKPLVTDRNIIKRH